MGTIAAIRRLTLICVFCLLAPAASLGDETFETFLKPNRVGEIMAGERERLVELNVADGDTIKRDQVLAVFDSRVLQARLELLKTAASFHGGLDSARALVELRRSKLDALESLALSGNARPQEIDTARTNLAIAEAQLQEAVENKLFNKAEQQVIQAQLEEKKLVSPIDGTVARVHKFEGDMVGGPGSEPIVTLVQLDPLTAEFHLPPEQAARLRENSALPLESGGKQIEAEVVFISPVIEAQSGTVLVRMQIPNADGAYQSGRRISLNLPVP